MCENDFKIGAGLRKDNQKAMGVDDNGGKQSKSSGKGKRGADSGDTGSQSEILTAFNCAARRETCCRAAATATALVPMYIDI